MLTRKIFSHPPLCGPIVHGKLPSYRWY
jgi:hypothetical protein